MAKVTIQFPSLTFLAAFYKSLSCPCYRIETQFLLLTCTCEESKILEAISEYGGKIILKKAIAN